MSGFRNRVELIGNLGKDPEGRTMQNGGRVVTMSIATSESWKDKRSGERVERTEWHRVVIFNEALGDLAEKYCRKGDKVLVEGKLTTRKFIDNDGIERYSTEIHLQPYNGELTFLSNKRDTEDRPARREASRREPAMAGDGPNDFAGSDPDAEIPF